MRGEGVSQVFREVNARIAQIVGTWEWEETQGFLCECATEGCSETIELTREQYEAIRSEPARFVTLAGHERADLERVVERRDGFVVVEKLEGAGESAVRDAQSEQTA